MNVKIVATKKQVKLALPLLFDGLGTFEDEEDNEMLNDLMETMEHSLTQQCKMKEGWEYNKNDVFCLKMCPERELCKKESVAGRDIVGQEEKP